MYIGKESRLVEIIHKKTKINKDDIVDIIRSLPDVMAEYIMEVSPPEKTAVHIGFANMMWQDSRGHKPEIVIRPTKRFKERMAQLKTEGKTPLARELYSHLLPNIKDRITNALSKTSKVLP